ncbi:MAG: dihydrolipoamide acetyltransferase family protein [Phycisphaerales bacterium]
MPRLSDTMEVGTVIKWNVKEGDKVRSGDVLADIETDKATMEMQCFDDGTVAKLLVEPGKQVKVGTLIAMLAAKGEDPATVSAATSHAGAVAPDKAEADDAEVVIDGGRLRVSPVARRMAEDAGIDVRTIKGSGPGGRVIKRDVQSAMSNVQSAKAPIETAAPLPIAGPSTTLARSAPAAAAAPPAPTAVTSLGAPRARKVELSGMRQTIARRLVESVQQIPHYQVSMRFAMDEVVRERAKLNEALAPFGVKLSVNDFLVRACALAMARHPFMNSSFAGDHVVVHGEVNVGIAISLPEERGSGLVVGVIRNADQKSLRQIAQEAKFLADKARTKGLTLDEMNGSTFTISNLGMYGVDHFTAIINPPNSAILACGAAVEQPVVREHQLVVGWEMQATLSLDHRVIDGAMAAEYLRTLKDLVEKPAVLLV